MRLNTYYKFIIIIIYVTKVTDSNRGRKACRAIEITPAMIQAGVQAFCGFYPDSSDGGFLDSKMVKAVFVAICDRGTSPIEVKFVH